jgi:hypothetical protein
MKIAVYYVKYLLNSVVVSLFKQPGSKIANYAKLFLYKLGQALRVPGG